MTLKRILILAFVLILPALGLAGATALGWLRFEWSLRGVLTVFVVYSSWFALLEGFTKLLERLRPYQAPRPLADFVGRRDEIKRLIQAFKPGARAAITGVVGIGGIGKTELAKVVAHLVARRYRDGVLWADCKEERLTDIADWPLLNALLNAVCGATWVAIHHGGGVGIGYSIHAGQVIVAGGTPEAAVRLERVLTADPWTAIIRHVDAGYEKAIEVAKRHGLKIPMMK